MCATYQLHYYLTTVQLLSGLLLLLYGDGGAVHTVHEMVIEIIFIYKYVLNELRER